MTILDADLLDEITQDPQSLGLAGSGAGAVYPRLNAPGSASVPAWIPSPAPMPVGKEEFLEKITSIAEAANLQRCMDGTTDLGVALKFKLTNAATIDMSRLVNRAFVNALVGASSTTATPITQPTADAILRLGEIQQSRAQELWGEPATLAQIKAVRGAS